MNYSEWDRITIRDLENDKTRLLAEIANLKRQRDALIKALKKCVVAIEYANAYIPCSMGTIKNKDKVHKALRDAQYLIAVVEKENKQ